jgi:hypothetical protein
LFKVDPAMNIPAQPFLAAIYWCSMTVELQKYFTIVALLLHDDLR